MQKLLERVPEGVRRNYQAYQLLSIEERIAHDCESRNSQEGTLEGYDCPDCKNRGYLYVAGKEEAIRQDCKCISIRRNLKLIEKSGLGKSLELNTFDSYKTPEKWQVGIKEHAFSFLEDHEKKWFYISGQPGCGKTHICTAIAGHFIKQGKTTKYMLWRDAVVELRAMVNDEEYQGAINQYKKARVLYIDDFMKTPMNSDGEYRHPTPGDLNIAFELINYRYVNPHLITILSSERSVKEVMQMDDAMGSRVYEMTKDYNIHISPDKKKNIRLK